MNALNQNWSNLFGDHTPEGMSWHGIWTRYSASQEVLHSLQCVRDFRTNEDKTVVYHTNTYISADGSTEEKKWQIEKKTCNQHDGIIHPGLPSMRALSIAPNIYAVLNKTLAMHKNFVLELFFRNEDWRTSVVIIYGENSTIDKLVHIREHLDSFPAQPPGAEVKNIDGKWVGEKQSISDNLSISNAEPIQNLVLMPLEDINQTFFLPDGIVINAPKSLQIGQEFSISAGKFGSPNQFKRLTAQYDNFGNFQLLISEIFHRQ